MGSVIFVHGTGVRYKSYQKDFKLIRRKLDKYAKGWTAVECAWGDQYGVNLNLQGRSIPDYPDQPAEQNELIRWWRLYQDPLCEMRELAAIEEGQVWIAPGQEAAWKSLDEKIKDFNPAGRLLELLTENDLADYWKDAAKLVKDSAEYAAAIERCASHPGHFRRTFARATFAQALKAASESGLAAPSARARDEIIDLAVKELDGDDMGVFDFPKAIKKMSVGALKSLGNIFFASGAAAAIYTGLLSRGKLSDKSFPAAGDILLYQTRGDKIRDFIKDAIASTIKDFGPPVYLLAHSLGGIACVDLLAMEQLGVAGLITAGSQAPLLYEMNSLASLADGAPLPKYFPRWLNFYDPNDLLSYIGGNVFPDRVKDVAIHSRQPFPQAHSAYWREAALWEEITQFLNRPV